MPEKSWSKESIAELITELGFDLDGTLSFSECVTILSKISGCSLDQAKKYILNASFNGELDPMDKDGNPISKVELADFARKTLKETNH